MGKKIWRKKQLMKVDLYYCRAERMQNKAETSKHETHFFKKRRCSISRASGGRWRDLTMEEGGRRRRRMKSREAV